MNLREHRIKPLVSYVNGLPDARTRKDFASDIGTSIAYIRLVMYGIRKPGADLVLKISEATGWTVTPHQIRPSTFRNPHDGLPIEIVNRSTLDERAT